MCIIHGPQQVLFYALPPNSQLLFSKLENTALLQKKLDLEVEIGDDILYIGENIVKATDCGRVDLFRTRW